MMEPILFLLCILPAFVSAYKASFGSYEYEGLSFTYKGIYMFDKKDVFTLSANGPSKIIFNYTAVNLKPNSEAQGEMDVAIVSDSVFEKIGYKDENGKTVLCCDSQAVEKGYCMNQGHILLPANAESEYVSQSLSLKKNKNTGILSYDVQKTGIYYVLAISCDYRAGLIRFSGEYEAVNPYGQLPAPQHGLLPFTFLLFACFLLLLVWWVYLSLKHSNDVMSVHVIILLVLIFFVLDLGARFIHLAAFNFVGRPLFILVLISIVLDCSTRTLTRILTLFVCMGLGVTKQNLDDTLITFKFVVFGVVYYLITFCDSYLTVYPTTNPTIEVARFVLTSSIDAIAYFWIFVSLMDTMEVLAERKQEKKLEIFTRLRNLLIVAVVLATLTLIGFSSVVIFDLSAKIWKYQWLMNQGLWDLFYLLLMVAIMIMWLPSENTSAYASHIQIATSEQTGEEEMPVDSLVDMEQEGSHIVEEASSSMKPMQVMEIQQE